MKSDVPLALAVSITWFALVVMLHRLVFPVAVSVLDIAGGHAPFIGFFLDLSVFIVSLLPMLALRRSPESTRRIVTWFVAGAAWYFLFATTISHAISHLVLERASLHAHAFDAVVALGDALVFLLAGIPVMLYLVWRYGQVSIRVLPVMLLPAVLFNTAWAVSTLTDSAVHETVLMHIFWLELRNLLFIALAFLLLRETLRFLVNTEEVGAS